MNARTITAAAVAGLALATVTFAGADASTKPSSTDKKVMMQANKTCASITDDVQFENCVVGTFVLNRHRYIDENYYTYNDNGDVVLTKASRKV